MGRPWSRSATTVPDFPLWLAIICLSDCGDPREAGAADAAAPVGLAIVTAIAEGHGGEIHAYTAEDGGAVFRVMLPITQVARAGDLPAARA
jgi:hypothetical protein